MPRLQIKPLSGVLIVDIRLMNLKRAVCVFPDDEFKKDGAKRVCVTAVMGHDGLQPLTFILIDCVCDGK